VTPDETAARFAAFCDQGIMEMWPAEGEQIGWQKCHTMRYLRGLAFALGPNRETVAGSGVLGLYLHKCAMAQCQHSGV